MTGATAGKRVYKRPISLSALHNEYRLIKKLLTCCDGSAFRFIFECAELLDVVKEETRRATIQVRKTIHALSGRESRGN